MELIWLKLKLTEKIKRMMEYGRMNEWAIHKKWHEKSRSCFFSRNKINNKKIKLKLSYYIQLYKIEWIFNDSIFVKRPTTIQHFALPQNLPQFNQTTIHRVSCGSQLLPPIILHYYNNDSYNLTNFRETKGFFVNFFFLIFLLHHYNMNFKKKIENSW